MKAFRLHRLLSPKSGQTFGVALDGNFPHESGSLPGPESIPGLITAFSGAQVDALRLTLEQASQLQQIPGKQRPALVLRADVTNVFATPLPERPFCRIVSNIVEQALRFDAAAVAVHLLEVSGHPVLTEQCLENIARLRIDCERWCLPLIVEIRPSAAPPSISLLQQVVSLGADLIALPTPLIAGNLDEIARQTGAIQILLLDRSPSIAPPHGGYVAGLFVENPTMNIETCRDWKFRCK